MKFAIRPIGGGTEENVSILPDNPDPDYSPMNPGSEHGHQPSPVAPKRTINEAGTIVLTPANEGEPPHIMGESSLAEESQEDETPNKKRKALRAKKFRSEWLVFDMFKGWLRAHPNPERAMCTACNIVLNAGKSELEKHATSIKHQKRMIQFRQVHQRLEYDGEQANVILVEAGSEADDAVSSNFLQRGDRLEGSSLTPDVNYADQPITIDMSHLVPPRKQTEAPSYTSKAVVTKPAPPWKATAIVNGHVTRLELNDYKGRYLILFFYPQDFSALCPTELLALSDRVLEFRALQTEIVACSVDSHLVHLAWARTPRGEGGLGNPKIPLLADPTHSLARDYGVLQPDSGHTLRAHFIIDRRGIIRHMQVNDLSVGRSIDELLRITQALQHADETETGCPADWKPGLPCV